VARATKTPNKRMQLTKLRAAPVLQAEVPPCAPAGRMDGGPASQLIPGVGPTKRGVAEERLMTGLRVMFVLVAAAVASGCSDQVQTACTADVRLGLGIVVVNDETGAHLCDAVATASSGSYSETLVRTSDARVSGCLYVGAAERPGTYSVHAEAVGFAGSTLPNVTVSVTRDGCHVQQVIGTIRLGPTG
jgi:hypothetical protein